MKPFVCTQLQFRLLFKNFDFLYKNDIFLKLFSIFWLKYCKYYSQAHSHYDTSCRRNMTRLIDVPTILEDGTQPGVLVRKHSEGGGGPSAAAVKEKEGHEQRNSEHFQALMTMFKHVRDVAIALRERHGKVVSAPAAFVLVTNINRRRFWRLFAPLLLHADLSGLVWSSRRDFALGMLVGE